MRSAWKGAVPEPLRIACQRGAPQLERGKCSRPASAWSGSRTPLRAVVRSAHQVNQQVVLGYWARALTTNPVQLQVYVDEQLIRLDAPRLAIFGCTTTEGERERLNRVDDVQLEEWHGGGHFVQLVHLVDPDSFTDRLRTFLNSCVPRQE